MKESLLEEELPSYDEVNEIVLQIPPVCHTIERNNNPLNHSNFNRLQFSESGINRSENEEKYLGYYLLIFFIVFVFIYIFLFIYSFINYPYADIIGIFFITFNIVMVIFMWCICSIYCCH
jgi:hypothetical protein